VDDAFPVTRFPALDETGTCRSAFVRRIPGIDVAHDKAEVLFRLERVHREIQSAIGMDGWPRLTAEQVHGDRIAVVDQPLASNQHFAGCDGLITNQRGLALGIHVADCCAVYLVDAATPAIGLVHSGKKGSELGIAAAAIEAMGRHFGSKAANLVVQLSPCIRPPHYEIDFAAKVVEQCRALGVSQIHDDGVCTACDLASYYSYRAEKGKTGRMLALLGLK
jgi:copper oxidase (laccase) domain-containing protein